MMARVRPFLSKSHQQTVRVALATLAAAVAQRNLAKYAQTSAELPDCSRGTVSSFLPVQICEESRP